jgi:hypothetical protein
MSLRPVVTRSAILLVPVLAVSWCAARDHLLEAHFGQVTSGMSRDDVVRLMGKPSWEDRCGAKMPTGLPVPCTKELGYSETLAPLLPRYYLIWFGNTGKVVHTAPITSP